MSQPDIKMPELKMIETNGIRLRVALEGDGPLIILVHGFPESWFSWRHQIGTLAAAGYRVAAPDVRGYGGSDKPHAIEAYDLRSLAGDMAGLVPALGYDTAIVIGHDWGAPIAWHSALLHEDRFTAVAALSVPYGGRGKMPFIEMCKQIYKGKFFYQLYFQEPGVAEAELEADVRGALRKFYYGISGEGLAKGVWPRGKGPDATLLEGMAAPAEMPAWLSDEELDYYVAQFEAGGFRGPLNRYRNSVRDWTNMPELADRKVSQPAAFIAGTLEPVLAFVPGVDLIEAMRLWVPDLRVVKLIEGAGHWVQQERPAEVNAGLLEFLATLK